MVLPRIISTGLRGVTTSCSMVPCSLSLITAMDVRSSEMIITRKATMAGTKKCWL